MARPLPARCRPIPGYHLAKIVIVQFQLLFEHTGAFVSERDIDNRFCEQIIDVQPDAKATVAAAGHEGHEDLMGMPVEALLGMDMAHPNVVQTYRHTSLPSSVSCSMYSSFLH